MNILSYFIVCFDGENMKKETILYGTAILILTNTAVKLMSLFYRSILIRFIGSEGLGLTELMMPIYSFLIVIASLGIPLAISNFISAEKEKNRIASILRTGTVLLAICGTATVLITFALFPLLKDHLFADPRVIPAFFILIPSVFVISVFSSLRGYFQGTHRSSVLGKSQVVEQIARISAGIFLISLLMSKTSRIAVVIMGFAAASLIAECCGGLYLWLIYRKDKTKSLGHFDKNIAKSMIQKGTPITMSRLVISATAAIQAVWIPQALMNNGATIEEAAAFYGLFAGVALTVLHLPSVVTGALTTPLMPSIATADSNGMTLRRNYLIAKSIYFTMITALPVLALIFWYAKEICDILFASPEAGPILALLSIGGIFLYLQQPILTILQGMNRFNRIFVHLCIADALYLISLLFLDFYGLFSVNHLLLLFIGNDILVFMLNYFCLIHMTGTKIPIWKTYFAPILSVFGGFIVLIAAEKKIMQTNIPEIGSMILSACVFLLFYFLTMYFSGAIDKKTISELLSRQKHR